MNQIVNLSPVYTVFTPTFNRAHTLHRVFDSLVAQTYRDFEWIVIDDGSTDDTQSLIKLWQQQADFPIHYHYQVNSGKHIAYNYAVKLAHGELFLVIDSDDGFVVNALESMLYWWKIFQVINVIVLLELSLYAKMNMAIYVVFPSQKVRLILMR